MAIDWNSAIIWDENSRRTFSEKNVAEETVKEIFEMLSVGKARMCEVSPDFYHIPGVRIGRFVYDLSVSTPKVHGKAYFLPVNINVRTIYGKPLY